MSSELTLTEIRTQVREFIAGRYPQQEIADHDDIFALGYVNSLFAMELVVFLEKVFGATIPNQELQIDNFRSVDRMVSLFERMRSGGSPAEAAPVAVSG
ncbi:acyl carrier protein [Plantactinospora sp. S1510]|uniref:Acyl carrier protein n=1 Tax=Plantactinospora alkalitolerans TaxID=2789879 RepID=A0ABS0H3M6_9ACTN|nr:acyl carrier protein [Plantactinospora alkalitolerans]MBF9132818.1 acyl carrier protein [Plantactinospora alkalitolerans]